MKSEGISIRRRGSSVYLDEDNYTSVIHCGNVSRREPDLHHVSELRDSCEEGVKYTVDQFIAAHALNELVKMLHSGSVYDRSAYVRDQIRDAIASIGSAQAVLRELRLSGDAIDISDLLDDLGKAYLSLVTKQ